MCAYLNFLAVLLNGVVEIKEPKNDLIVVIFKLLVLSLMHTTLTVKQYGVLQNAKVHEIFESTTMDLTQF